MTSLTAGGLTLVLAQAPLASAPQGVFLSLGYEALGTLHPSQGLVPARVTTLGWLNPGADLDASVSTDGEDIAAPLADVAEFRSKDASLAIDAFYGAVTAANVGVAGAAAALATNLAHDVV